MLQIQAVSKSNPPCLKLSGDLTIYCVAQAKGEISSALEKKPVLNLDLNGIEEIDTAGVQLLLWLKRQAEAGNGSLTLLHHSPSVVEVLDLLRVAGLLGDPILIDPAAR